jgi:hypothetical protein
MASWVVRIYNAKTDALVEEIEVRQTDRASVRAAWGLHARAPINHLVIDESRLAFVNSLLDQPLKLGKGRVAYLEEEADFDGEVIEDLPHQTVPSPLLRVADNRAVADSEINWCCEMMRVQATSECDMHDRFECPDAVLTRFVNSDGAVWFGIPVHDGGGSAVSISCCPWCGTRLTSSKAGHPRLDV